MKVIIKCENIKHWDILGCFHYILSAPRIHSSFAIILMEKRGMVTLLSLSFWCLVMVVWLFLAVPCVCLRFVIVFFFLFILTNYFCRFFMVQNLVLPFMVNCFFF